MDSRGRLSLLNRFFPIQSKPLQEEAESKAELQGLFQQAAVGIAQVDRDGRYMRVNQKICDMLGYTEAELLNRPVFDFVHPDHVAEAREKYAALFKGEIQTFTIEKRYLRKDGTVIWGNRSTAAVKGPDGKVKHAVSVLEDITEKRRSRDHSKMLVEASKVLFSSLDYKSTFKSVAKLVLPQFADWVVFDILRSNGGVDRIAVEHADPGLQELAQEIKKYPPKKEFSNISWLAIETEQPRFEKNISQDFVDSQSQSPEHQRIIAALGLNSLISIPLMAQERMLGALTLVLGHSGRVYSEDDIPFAQELASRAAIALDNAQLYESLSRALQTRDEFMSIASHELKTPLTSLRLQIQMRRRYISRRTVEEFTWDKLEKMLDGDERQVLRLTHLIDDMLDLTRINTGKLSISPEECDLSELVREVVERHSAHLIQAGCKVALEADARILGSWDRFRIEQVVTNLISNAAKYAPNAPVEISVKRMPRFAELRVKDSGKGIRKEDQARVFDRFERAVSTNAVSGFGLGLYITRQIVELHGGVIRIESEPGKGAAFIVELPFNSDFLKPRCHSHEEYPCD